MSRVAVAIRVAVVLVAGCAACVLANGGPFVINYPGGDPAAKGVLARLDPNLKPRRETTLRVMEENLKIVFERQPFANETRPPIAHVVAEYTIENPTSKSVEVDFGFPILRGIHIDPFSMMPGPDVRVRLGDQPLKSTIISNSAIYGIIRQRARQTIEDRIVADEKLHQLAMAVGKSQGSAREKARQYLSAYLTGKKKSRPRDAAPMVEYAGLDFDDPEQARPQTFFFGPASSADETLRDLPFANLGPLSAIGEQKATQFFAQLASKFDPKAASTYESIFESWGGDVRERSVDLRTGKVRPREYSVSADEARQPHLRPVGDPTVYARVDYLDPDAKIKDDEKAACRSILKNLPVVFTFAPMNLLHYQTKFPPNSKQILSVDYRQYAYADTRAPESYQISYVVHPASLWKDFGPIRPEVAVPEGVALRASVPCANGGSRVMIDDRMSGVKTTCDLYKATLESKTGEILVGIDSAGWRRAISGPVEVRQQAAGG